LLVIAEWVSWKETAAKSEKAQRSEDSVELLPPSANGMMVADDDTLNPTVLAAVIKVVKQVGENRAKDVDAESNIVHLGLDSMERLDIAHTLEQMFGGRIPEEVLQDVETVREVAEAIETHVGVELVDGSATGAKIGKDA